nr:CoA transferase [Cupriavidus necator]
MDRALRSSDTLEIVGCGRKNRLLDLKQSEAAAQVLNLLEHADALVGESCPGVMERLGLGPEVVAMRNPPKSPPNLRVSQ